MSNSTIGNILAFLKQSWEYLSSNLTDLNVIIQLLAVILLGLVAFLLGNYLINRFFRQIRKDKVPPSISYRFFNYITSPLLLLVFLLILRKFFLSVDYPVRIVQIVISLCTMWVMINFAAVFIRNPLLKKGVFLFAMLIALLGSLGLLHETIALLDSVSLQTSGIDISLYTIIRALLLLLFLSWLARRIGDFLEHRVKISSNLKPSLRVLIAKMIKVTLFIVVFFLIISSLGINLTAFAVFTGAVGIGVGLGLQKVVANILSGIILLLDESVKPGDVIEIDSNFGCIKTMGARYVSVVAFDGKEYLIPNEDLITNRVINWSHSDDLIRVDVQVGVSYRENIHAVIDILQNVPAEFERIRKEPEPLCYLTEFGSSSINFLLSFWINDPENGILNIKSQILTKIWDKFKEHGIEIPFPQRDVHIKSINKTNPDLNIS
ncbi:MAG: mechanosensitive ion channel [Candidatus Cloacimonetes bacterium]|nr:mechanosensitive ion channel [Candidatus Cloacimonadota bacterium]